MFLIDDVVGGATSVVGGGSSWSGVGAGGMIRGLVISRFTAVGSDICFVLVPFHLYNCCHEGNEGYEGQGDEEGH